MLNTAGVETPLIFSCSGLGLGAEAYEAFDPLANAWTALRRSLGQQHLVNRPKPPNHAEVRSCVSLAYSEYRVSYL